MKPHMIILAMSMAASGPVAAQNVDWGQDPVPQAREQVKTAMKQGQTTIAGAPVQQAEQAKTGLSYYKGKLFLGKETRNVCMAVSPEKIDRFAGDPDVSQGVFVSQAVPVLSETEPAQDLSCQSSVEYNGSYIKTCSGLYLSWVDRTKDDFTSGDIFSSLQWRGSATNQPLGTYRLKPAASCTEEDRSCAVGLGDSLNHFATILTATRKDNGVYTITNGVDTEQVIVNGNREIKTEAGVPHWTPQQIAEKYRTIVTELMKSHKVVQGQDTWTLPAGSACQELDIELIMFLVDEWFYYG